jgi:adenine-specific DNA-methyltransferase
MTRETTSWVIKYLGSKRTLVPLIEQVVQQLPVRSVCDLFAGTTRVGQALRRQGLHVVSNDTATYSEVLGQAYIAATGADRDAVLGHLTSLNDVSGRRGYFTKTFCEGARYLQPDNGARVDAIRDAIEDLDLDAVARGLLLAALLEAADRVDSTTGVQMAYLKSWAPRSSNPLQLRMPNAVDGPVGTVVRQDANALAGALDVDLVYIDPPYNQHSYFSNYHVWETLIRWDRPSHYGIANKREDCRTTKSLYNSKPRAAAALADLLARLEHVPWVVVSVSDEGYHDPADVVALLAERGHVAVLDVDYKRYVGAQIGIHNPDGERVGTVSHLRNTEHLLVCGPDAAAIAQVKRIHV